MIKPSTHKTSEINSQTWRKGYANARRSILHDNEKTTRFRLTKMGVWQLLRSSYLLDFGCGDGNLTRYLKKQGFCNVFGIEPDYGLLLKDHLLRGQMLVGKAPQLPFEEACFDAIISMAVLHHLPDQIALQHAIQEFHRILKPGGMLCYAEPSDTWIRAMLTPILLSPLSQLTRFSRQKRLMVLEELETLQMWLRLERTFAQQILCPSGFRVMYLERNALKTFVQAVKI
jgi:SAM-dependent methyltransferase